MNRPATVAVMLALSLTLAGCVERTGASMSLLREQLAAGQEVVSVQMETCQAVYAAGADGWTRTVMGFPLPGCKPSAKPTYYLFLRTRTTTPQTQFAVGQSEQAMILTLGHARELQRIAIARSGSVYCRPDNGRLTGSFELLTAENEHLRGQFVAAASPEAIERFQSEFLNPRVATTRPTTRPATRPDAAPAPKRRPR